MAGGDRELREALRRAAEPPETSGVYDRVARRRTRYRLRTRLATAALVVVVLAGTAGASWALARAFGLGAPDQVATQPAPAPAPGQFVELIAFSSYRDGRAMDVYVMRPDGSDVRRLTDGPPEVEDHQPSWSPDGSMIAFTSTRSKGSVPTDTGNGDIFVMRADGSEVRRISFGFDSALEPAWSPDGKGIAFAGFQDRNWDIYVAPVEGGEPLRLTTDRAFEHDPAWSPDGTSLAFVRTPDEGRPSSASGIFDLDITTGRERKLTDAYGVTPAWSPDGQLLAYAGGATGSGINVMEMASGQVREVADDPESEGDPSWPPHDPAWSADGGRIAFTSYRVNGEGDIFTIELDGSDLVQLTDNPLGDYDAAWRPIEPTTPAPTSPAPTATPSSTATPEPTATDEPRCRERSTLRGDFDGDGEADTARLFECSGDSATWTIELDWNGPAGFWELAECDTGCALLAAPDLDGNGKDELAVVTFNFSIQEVVLYVAPPRKPGPAPLTVAPPGDPEGGFEPGAIAEFGYGGDAFWTYNVRCEDRPEGRVIIQTAAESLPHDSVDAVWHVHETVLRLVGSSPLTGPDPDDGAFEIVSVTDYTLPTEDPEQGVLFADHEEFCGAPVGR